MSAPQHILHACASPLQREAQVIPFPNDGIVSCAVPNAIAAVTQLVRLSSNILRALLQARGIGGRTDQRRRRTQRVISLNPVIIERLRGAAERRAVEDDIVVGQPDGHRPTAILSAGPVVAAHAVADVGLRRRERALRFNACPRVP